MADGSFTYVVFIVISGLLLLVVSCVPSPPRWPQVYKVIKYYISPTVIHYVNCQRKKII